MYLRPTSINSYNTKPPLLSSAKLTSDSLRLQYKKKITIIYYIINILFQTTPRCQDSTLWKIIITTTSPFCKISIIVHFRDTLKNHLQHKKWPCQHVDDR